MNTLINALRYGFTVAQLEGYSQFRAKTSSRVKAADTPSYPWMTETHPWTAPAVGFWNTWVPKHATPKTKAIARLLREAWNLKLEEEETIPGEMMIRLSPRVFQAATASPNRILETSSNEYLDVPSDEAIKLVPEQYGLRIRGTKAKTAAILARIDELVRSEKTKVITVEGVEEDFSETALKELERLTGTSLHYSKLKSELSVSWIPGDGPGEASNATEKDGATASEGTEDPADIVLRHLTAHRVDALRNEVQLLTSTGKSRAADAMFVRHYRENRALSWVDRLQPWWRCVSPVGKEPLPSGDGRASLLDAHPTA
ncbi:hypothetical protein CDD83_2405 [Cordyceps sp. RAO-2017]|nr:hypothetical protein CDD83_2405 [Cordyceps sp. RAO-2017]